MSFTETEEQKQLRKAVAQLSANYGADYYLEKARAGEHTTELWSEAGKLGFIGVNLPEEYGGGGAGMYELSLVMEEMSAGGCALLLMVVSPAINGTIISKYGTDEQKKRWVPGIADGSITMAFAITEPDAGSNSHRITTTARRDGSDWVLNGQKVYISGVDQAQAVLVVGRSEDHKTGNLKPALFVVPTDTPGLTWTKIDMEIVSPENQFQLFLDDVRLPADALVGSEDAAIAQLFAGLNPERIMGAASAVGMGRFAINKATEYVKTRQVWKTPIGAHQGIAHPLAQNHIEIELAKLMMQKAATLYDLGDDGGAAEAANMAKYAAGEASVRAVDQAVQSLGGNGLTKEYGIASVLTASRLARIAPVSREMILNFVAQTSLGLPGPTDERLREEATRLMSQLVDYALDGAVARLTLNSPHNHNALSTALVAQLRAGLAEAAASGARAVVLGHSGKTFCAGADLSEAAGRDPGDLAVDRAREMTQVLRAILELPVPVIAAIDGNVRAGGLGLVGACDIAVAGPASTFALTEARIGVAPSIISLTLLPKLDARAAGRYFVTGEKFGADEAARIGLVTIAAESSADVGARVSALAAETAKGSPQGLAASKALTTAAILEGFDRHAEALTQQSARLFVSDEAREGMMAFLEKRPPAWVSGPAH